MYPEITFTITTCKRLKMLRRTMESFKAKCQDMELIKRWILVDDGSSEEDLQKMKDAFPQFEIYTNAPKKGQPVSLNKIINMVDTEWFFHCEDDWLFLKQFYIRDLFKIAFDDLRIKNVIMRYKVGNIVHGSKGRLLYNLHRYDPVLQPPLVEHINPSIADEDSNWFGYSWNPGLHHIPTLRIMGALNENGSTICRQWDREHALKYLELGLKRANPVDDIYIEHIGEGLSAEYVH